MACVRPSSRARVVSKYILTAAGEHLDRGGSSVSAWLVRRPADACAWPACRVCRVCLCGRGARVCPVCCGGCSGEVGAGFLPCGVHPSVRPVGMAEILDHGVCVYVCALVGDVAVGGGSDQWTLAWDPGP